MPVLVEVALRSGVVYVAILLALRLAGKRHAGQLSPHDLVLMLLVSNAVQNAMVGEHSSLADGLVAAGTLIGINVIISRFLLHHRRWGPLLAGHPTLLVHNGELLPENLERERLLPEELLAQIRAHGFEEISDVRTAVQECDGSISVIGYATRPEVRIPPGGRL